MFGRFRDYFPKKRQAVEPLVPPAGLASASLADGESGAQAAANQVEDGSQPRSETVENTQKALGAEAKADTAKNAAKTTGAERVAGQDAVLPPARTPAQRTGDRGEDAAAAFLAEKGHKVLERNWRAGRDEIDLITKDGVALVFVEVRTRAENALVGGFHSIDARKKAALRRVCGAYLKTCRPRPQTYRLDVVQISIGKGGQMTIHHYAGVALFN